MKIFPSTVFVLLFAATVFAQLPVKTIDVAGVKEKVTVRRDGRWIPYIAAGNDADLYFAQGYVTASDRLWQMDLMRRLARGETAEIFGKATLEEDKRWRRFGFAAIAEKSLNEHSPELLDALRRYADGVNAYIANLDDASLPVEFRMLQYRPRPWSPADTVVIGKILAGALSSTWQRDLVSASLRALPKEKRDAVSNQVTPYDVVLFGSDVKASKAGAAVADRDLPPVSPELVSKAELLENLRNESLRRVGLLAEDLAASNNWVISGKRTADGKAILANDPHLEPTAPGIWYLTHLSSPALRVSGVTIPGVPGIVLGHNQNYAWGATNVGPDVQDLIKVDVSEGKVRTAEGPKLVTVRKETIKVRVNPLKTDVETVEYEVTETPFGPIILEDKDTRYALKWTALEPRNVEFQAFYALNRAGGWTDFRKALAGYSGATQNFVYADTKGNIGWQVAGRVPIRRAGDGSLPYDGSNHDDDWVGWIPFDELPNLYNPANGFIVTANQRITGTSYKYPQISRDAASPWRARRLFQILSSNDNFTLSDAAAAQFDSFNIPLSNFAKLLVEMRSVSEGNAALLNTWDGRMSPDSQAALMVNQLRICTANKIADDNKPVPAATVRERILEAALRERLALWLPKAYADYGALIKTCEAETEAMFTSRFGGDRSGWVWGKMSAARFQHPLAAVPLLGGQFATPKTGLNGSGQTPNVGSYVSMRHVTSPGNWDATMQVIPLGQSGDPRSPHFIDQFPAWGSGAIPTFPFSKTAVEKAAGVHVEFVPKVEP